MSPWRRYESSGPIAVEGGVKAKSKRGAIGEQWWSQRFIAVLDSYGLSSRLQRGRAYARRGQVIEFALEPGVVAAYVQGSRSEPYLVTIKVRTLTAAQWGVVESRLAGQALFRARLLAGEMPQEIEQVFGDCGTPLFPRSARDLTMNCSCPDWEVPRKHVAAVCYVLAEAFDADPFTMLAWRGKGRDELLGALRGKTAATAGASGHARRHPASPAGPAGENSSALAVLSDVTGGPLTESLADFWSPGLSQARLRTLPFGPPTPPDLLLRLADPPDLQVRGAPLREVLTRAYARLAAPELDALSALRQPAMALSWGLRLRADGDEDGEEQGEGRADPVQDEHAGRRGQRRGAGRRRGEVLVGRRPPGGPGVDDEPRQARADRPEQHPEADLGEQPVAADDVAEPDAEADHGERGVRELRQRLQAGHRLALGALQ